MTDRDITALADHLRKRSNFPLAADDAEALAVVLSEWANTHLSNTEAAAHARLRTRLARAAEKIAETGEAKYTGSAVAAWVYGLLHFEDKVSS